MPHHITDQIGNAGAFMIARALVMHVTEGPLNRITKLTYRAQLQQAA